MKRMIRTGPLSKLHQSYRKYKDARLNRALLERLLADPDGSAIPDATYVCAAGLANRLRSHLVAHAYSIRTGRRLVVNWPKTEECLARFTDLFEPLPERLSTRKYRLIPATLQDLGQKVDPSLATILDIRWQYVGGEAWLDALGAERGIVRDGLSPTRAIRETVESYSAAWPSKTIGMHIRRGDFVALGQAVSNLQKYLDALRVLEAKFGVEAVYVASDGTDEELAPIFSGLAARVFRRPAPPRDTTEGVQAALIDLLLLSRCHALVGTSGSSFSDMAAYLGDIPEERTVMVGK